MGEGGDIDPLELSSLWEREPYSLVDLGFVEFEALRNHEVLLNETIFGTCIYYRNLFSSP